MAGDVKSQPRLSNRAVLFPAAPPDMSPHCETGLDHLFRFRSQLEREISKVYPRDGIEVNYRSSPVPTQATTIYRKR